MLAITGGTIIDGNGGTPIGDGVILIEGDRIIAVGGASTAIPSHAQKIAVDRKYILPGLLDANVHLVLDIWPMVLVQYENRYDELIVEAAQLTLKGGVTTVFDTWGPRKYLSKARGDIKAGKVDASRIFFAGNIVGLGGPYSEDFFPNGQEALFADFTERTNAVWQENVGPELVWMSPDQVREQMRRYLDQDLDFVKFAVTTHRGDMQHFQFSPRIQQVIIDEAQRAGKTVQTHTTTNEALDFAICAGVDLMQHVDLTYGSQPIPAETIALMKKRNVPGALLPETEAALAWYRDNVHRTPFLKRYETMDINARAVVHAGVTLLLSTDGGVFGSNTLNSSLWTGWVPPVDGLLKLGEGHFNWLLAVEQKGMKAMDALLAATRNIARAYKVDDDLGTLEEGKIADLLVLDKDPLESAAHYRSIHFVMKDGRVVDRDTLPTKKRLSDQPSPPR